ncbi:MAG: hypothetical protein V4719_18110 [Planctomycetota bacterium]
MISHMARGAAVRHTGLLATCFALFCVTQLVGAGKSPMKVLKYDPAAEKMDLFAAIEAKALSVRIVAHDAEGGNVFFENLSGKPLTVELPEAVAMTQVLRQVGNGFFGNPPAGNGQNGSSSGFSNVMGGGQQGGAQSLGSGFNQQSTTGTSVGNNASNIPGIGIFSIPAERVAQVPFRAVCLDYGKPDPSPRMTYKPVPLETYTEDKVLQETLRIFGQGRTDQSVAQAAAWHLTDKLSWEKLSQIKKFTIPGVFSSQVPIFTKSQLKAAQEMVSKATKRAQERPTEEPQIKPREGARGPALETASAK